LALREKPDRVKNRILTNGAEHLQKDNFKGKRRVRNLPLIGGYQNTKKLHIHKK